MASITYISSTIQSCSSADSVTNVENAYEVCLAEIRVHFNTAEEENIPKDISRQSPRHLNIFFIVFKRSEKSVVRCKDYFMKDYKEWLDQTLVFNVKIETFLANIVSSKLILLCQITWMKMCQAHHKKPIWDIQLRTGTLFHIVPRKKKSKIF